MANPEKLLELLKRHGFAEVTNRLKNKPNEFKGTLSQFNALVEDCQLPPQWSMPAPERPRPTPQAQRAFEERVKVREEALTLLDLIVMEWKTDPLSVQCFGEDLRKRAEYVVALVKAGY